MPATKTKKSPAKRSKSSSAPTLTRRWRLSKSIVLAFLVLASTLGVYVYQNTFAATSKQTELKSALGNYCVSVNAGDRVKPGDHVNLAPCSGVNGQNWTFTGSQIMFTGPGGATHCAQPQAGKFNEGVGMVAQPCSSAATKRWAKQSWGGIEAGTLSPGKPNAKPPVKPHTLCLTVPSGRTGGTPQLELHDCNKTFKDQKWSNASAPASPGGGSSSPVGQQILKVARSQIGVKETCGENCGPQVNVYNFGTRQPWCNFFVQWVYWKAGYGMKSKDTYQSLGPCLNIDAFFNGPRGNWYANTKKNRDQHTPQAGDYIDTHGGRHCAIVDHVSKGIVYTIDGNVSDQVGPRHYTLGSSVIVGWGRLKSAE